MKIRNNIKVLALLVVAVLLLSGCSQPITVWGGGQLDDACHPRSQTIFSIKTALDDCEEASGHFTYFDKQNRVKIKGCVTETELDKCYDGPGEKGTIKGVYTDACGATGATCITIIDTQCTGQLKGEYFEIKLYRDDECGPWYSHGGELARGNYKLLIPECNDCD